MPTTEEKLLAEVYANPDQDEARLVLADWYDEQSNPRGELIRRQCAMELLDWDDPQYVAHEDAVDRLIAKHRAKWVKQLPKLTGVTWGNYDKAMSRSMWDDGRLHFRRGMVELAAVRDAKSFEAHMGTLASMGCVGLIDLVNENARGRELLLNFENLRALSYRQQSIDEIDVSRISKCPRVGDLEALSINEASLERNGLEQLCEIEFPKLLSLDLHFNSLGDCLEPLYQWSTSEKLRWLNIGLNDLGGRYNQITTDHIEQLASQNALRNLFSLNLWGNGLGPEHLSVFGDQAVMTRLTHLSLSRNAIGDEGAIALTRGRFRSLRVLLLNSTQISDKSIHEIANNGGLTTIQRLDISRNDDISNASMESIAESTSFASLTHLNLPGTSIDDDGAQALVESKTLNNLRLLNIGGLELRPTTIQALRRRFPRAVVKKPYH